MRYVGQGHEIRVPLPAGEVGAAQHFTLLSSFEMVYRDLYERLGPPVPVEILNWRIVSSGPAPALRLQVTAPSGAGAQSALKGERPAYFPETGGFVPTPVYDRYRLSPGATFDGPAIVEERESTAVLGPGAHGQIDDHWNLIVRMKE